MNILFLGSFFEKSHTKQLRQNSKGVMTISADTFQQALLDGWERSGCAGDLSLVTLPCVGSFPKRYKRIWVKGHNFVYGGNPGRSGGFLNLPQIKQWSISISARFHALRWAKRVKGTRRILVYALFDSYLHAAVAVKRRYPDTEICVIVLDLPEYFDDKTSVLRRWLKGREQRALDRLLPFVDTYVLLTRQMGEALGVETKPSLIVEGVFSEANSRVDGQTTKESHKTILYTGKLDNRFGIDDLLMAFCRIDDPNYRLWICGDGSARDDVQRRASADHRIVYFGNVRREEALILQRRATVLVNPRKGDEEYTKYSFPSKTMEYMASGTPTVMYPLPGMPEEYRPHVGLIADNTIYTLASTLREWCEKPAEELQHFGEEARRFILENKNSAIQARRIYDFITTDRYGKEKK